MIPAAETGNICLLDPPEFHCPVAARFASPVGLRLQRLSEREFISISSRGVASDGQLGPVNWKLAGPIGQL